MKSAYAAAAALAIYVGSVANASHAAVFCPPNLGPVEVDDVIVNGPCTLRLTEVDGDVTVRPGGSLLSLGADIDGSIFADRANRIRLLKDATTGEETSVEDNVRILRTTNPSGTTSQVIDADIDGSLFVIDNKVPVNVYNNDIDGSVIVRDNDRIVRLRDNDIDGNLACSGNSPRPFDGGGNEIDGSATGQCAGFDDDDDDDDDDNDDD
jgi:hypothetical protein